MLGFFASLYEWFGLIPLYSRDMGDQLRGWDITCTDYIATPWYVNIGWIMIILTGFIYALQYHILDSSTWNKKRHWWIFALLIFALNFLIAFAIPFNTIQSGNFCNTLILTVSDCIGFGISNALWSFILFLIISSNPLIRKNSDNCRHTTFWKP
jgi:hypothetical protein